MEASSLRNEKDYVAFAKKVSNVLYAGSTPYNLPAFMTELARGVGKVPQLSAIDLKKIVDTFTVVYNSKITEEKKAEGGGKKNKKAKPMIAAGKAAGGASRINNPAMVNDLMGDEDEYGAEDGNYGAEGFTKEAEADYDFI